MARGTEWAELIKQMGDEEFTKATGIGINVNILPEGQLNAGNVNALMLAISSGNEPDIALGVAPGSPVEFAIRHAVYDLSLFSDFDEIAARFLPSIFTSFTYQDGVYALPENMDFMVMIYRTDIIRELGITLPDTRQDLYDRVLPVLNQNNMQFYYPADFSQFILQHGASYYREDGALSGWIRPRPSRGSRNARNCLSITASRYPPTFSAGSAREKCPWASANTPTIS